MSSFIVSSNTLGHIRYHLELDPLDRTHYPLGCIRDYNTIAEALGTLPDDPELLDTLMLAMQELNERAVNLRYGESSASVAIAIKAVRARPMQAYKSLCCWLYQCCEDDVPHTPLYKAMRSVSRNWACEILENLPEYDRCSWDYRT